MIKKREGKGGSRRRSLARRKLGRRGRGTGKIGKLRRKRGEDEGKVGNMIKE